LVWLKCYELVKTALNHADKERGGVLAGFTDSFLKVAKEHGPFAALAVIMLAFFGRLAYWLIREVIKTKDAEIERLVEERNKLQDVISRERLSTRKKKK
jgi:hypothetical protein